MRNFILLIHHHAIAYRDVDGSIHVPSFIGRWVSSLADYVGEIRLLLYESNIPLSQQDETIYKTNVTLWSLGPPGRTWDRIPRIRRLRKACRRASENADGLLIRGITPRQMIVWKAVNVPHKAFLLVGSLLQSQPVFKLTFWGMYEYLMMRWRKMEVLNMAREGVLLANSPALADELAGSGGDAAFVPTNTLSIKDIPPLHVHELSTPRRLLFCGRVVHEKGIRELIQALAELNKLFSCELDVVGPVDIVFQQELRQLADELGVSQKIKWHGRISYGHELMRFYQKSDVFILPTYYEGFPHVIWEAAANSCPVITTNVGGIPALWRDGEHGILIPAKSSSSITKAVITLLTDHALRASFVENAYKYVKGFTVEACTRQLVNALRKQGWGE